MQELWLSIKWLKSYNIRSTTDKKPCLLNVPCNPLPGELQTIQPRTPNVLASEPFYLQAFVEHEMSDVLEHPNIYR